MLLKIRESLTCASIFMALALAFNTAWVMVSFQSLNMYATSDQSEMILNAAYLISIIVLSLTFAFMAVFEHAAGCLLDKRPLMWVCAVLLGIATAAMPFCAYFEAAYASVILVSASMATGILSSFLLTYTGMILCSLPLNNIIMAASLGQTGSIALFGVSIFLDPIPATAYSSILPLLCALSLHIVYRTATKADDVKIAPLSNQNTLRTNEEHAHALKLVMRVSTVILLVNFAYELARTLFIQMDIAGYGSEHYLFLQTITGFLVTLGSVIVSLALLKSTTINKPRLCWWFLVIFVIGSLLLIPEPFIYHEQSTLIPYTLNQAANFCFGLFMWIMTAYLCQNFSSSRVRIFSTIRLFWALGPLFGLLVGRYIVGYVGLTPETAYPCMMIAVFAALIGMTCVFNENVMADVMAIMPIEKRERFREKCRAVAEKYQLSNREAEIMTFFAKGRNLAYIQEELNISKSTVSSHRQHIYQKLNIHSQQELLDVIQATDPS